MHRHLLSTQRWIGLRWDKSACLFGCSHRLFQYLQHRALVRAASWSHGAAQENVPTPHSFKLNQPLYKAEESFGINAAKGVAWVARVGLAGMAAAVDCAVHPLVAGDLKNLGLEQMQLLQFGDACQYLLLIEIYALKNFLGILNDP